MKKYIVYAGMFLGSFLVINVGMYFVLSMTQPETVNETSELADSTGMVPDSAAVALQDTSIQHEAEQAAVPEEPSDEIAQTLPVQVQDTIPQTDVKEESAAVEPAHFEITAEDMSLNQQTIPQEETSESYNEEQAVQAALSQQEINAPKLAPNQKELAKLAKLLEGMKPAEAAAIASRLDIEEIVALVMKMKDRKAAKMMAELPISTAALVAQRMSELVEQQGVKS